MSSDHWSVPYVGLPYTDKGADRAGISCWGLCVLVYRERLNVELPTYSERFASKEERAEIAAIFDDATKQWPWWPVSQGAEREMDVAVFRRCGADSHVGIVISGRRMLHISAGEESRIERYDDGRWKPRLSGFYRHAELAQQPAKLPRLP